jgi:hypothetical protein
MLRRFCHTQNLRCLFDKRQLPDCISDLIPALQAAFNGSTHGTLVNDSLAFAQEFAENSPPDGNLSNLSDEIYSLFQVWTMDHDQGCDVRRLCPRATKYTKFERLGETYQVAASSHGSSKIVYRGSVDWSAGRIREIFSHTRQQISGNVTETFLVIDSYAPLSHEHAQRDHYRKFPHSAGGRLFYDRFLPQPVLLRKRDVVCHFAGISHVDVSGIDGGCIWVLPLNKVGFK